MDHKTDNAPVIVWLRQDLRLSDNPALHHAVTDQPNAAILFLYILDEVSEGTRAMGAAQKWWLHHSLTSLGRDIQALGGQLILRSGPATDIIDDVMQQSGAVKICWNRRYGEGEQNVDRQVKAKYGDAAKSFGGMLLHEPSQIRTGSDMPYKVYTPFWKKLCAGPPPRLPLPRPDHVPGAGPQLESEELASWSLLPTSPDWAGEIHQNWQPGEAGAGKQLAKFAAENINSYGANRDFPGPDRTARISPHLRFGEISPYQLWHASFPSGGSRLDETSQKSRETWRKELVWREFSYHLLQEWPDLDSQNFNPKFDGFPWTTQPEKLAAWQSGQTGYPIVDAGMRQLWRTGWMHNRVRMIVGSFLVKHLLIDWREGERWFWDTLVDGDPAANPAQWQWVAGTGADAAPYFRIFNPILQAQKFDPKGTYIHQYVPELAKLPAKFLAAPWEAPEWELAKAGVRLGETYPKPIVDHQQARSRALDALQSLNQAAESA
ncbi:MAG: deoxyribodipyrimidine photo-lyase [Rhizobiaceae bacterium]